MVGDQQPLAVPTDEAPFPRPSARAPQPMSQQVYATLRRMLMVGHFRPGEAVSLRTLAARLGTSAMPVREAVNRLIAEQALQLMSNRQVIVPHMTRRKFAELSKVRQMLECLAAANACEIIPEPCIDQLERHHGRLMEVSAGNDTSRILEGNCDFHFMLYEAGRSEILLPMIEALWMQAGPFLFLSLSKLRPLWTGDQHVAMVAALRRRDRAALITAVQRDIDDTAEQLMRTGVFDG